MPEWAIAVLAIIIGPGGLGAFKLHQRLPKRQTVSERIAAVEKRCDDKLATQATKHESDMGKVKVEVRELRQEIAVERGHRRYVEDYAEDLRRYISEGGGPPPPDWPPRMVGA